jgi:hypothetical protein
MDRLVDLLKREAESGFARLVGTRLTGTLPLTAAVLNDAIRRSPRIPPGLTVEILDSNRLVARYGVVSAAAVLDDDVRVGGGAPQIAFELNSVMVAWALKQAVRLPALRIEGRRVTVDVGALDGVDPTHPLWSYLLRARLRTTPGHVHIDFEAGVR